MAKTVASAKAQKEEVLKVETPEVVQMIDLQIESTLYKVNINDQSTLAGIIGALKVRVANDKIKNPTKYVKLNDRIVRVNGKKMTVPQMLSWVSEQKQRFELFYSIRQDEEAQAIKEQIDIRLKMGMHVPLTFGELSERKFDKIVESVGLNKPQEFIKADLCALIGM